MLDLISKRAALEAIQKAYDEVEVPKEDGDNLLEVQVACGVKVGVENALLAAMDVPPTWVSVNDRLPEEDKRVLIYDDVCREVCVANLYEGTWHGEAYQEEHDASHWMELPAPPVD